MITGDISSSTGALAAAGPGGQPVAPPVEVAMAPTAVILMLIGEENRTLGGDSPRGARLDMRL